MRSGIRHHRMLSHKAMSVLMNRDQIQNVGQDPVLSGRQLLVWGGKSASSSALLRDIERDVMNSGRSIAMKRQPAKFRNCQTHRIGQISGTRQQRKPRSLAAFRYSNDDQPDLVRHLVRETRYPSLDGESCRRRKIRLCSASAFFCSFSLWRSSRLIATALSPA